MTEIETPPSLNDRIAQRVRDLRAARGLSLDALATHCGVSRSMISLIERGESSPTAVLLEKLATGLGVSLASLFDAPAPAAAPEPVSRAADQLQWRDPHSGYVRRNVSPGGFASPIQVVEVLFPPKARVAYETAAREPVIHQQVWVLDGVIELTVGEERHRLATGDCLAMVLDRPTSYYNPSRKTTRYAVVIATVATALSYPAR
ncbi:MULTISPECIES: helix-turn-helix domain-containing protein [unclassified Variovorax]|uniref:helix-turn-helix domain-containing protein n=1 Tax=unclassified Variovorax TaxID=663243 RepID=UPI003F47D6F3